MNRKENENYYYYYLGIPTIVRYSSSLVAVYHNTQSIHGGKPVPKQAASILSALETVVGPGGRALWGDAVLRGILRPEFERTGYECE